jgi:UDP-glucose 4-epimerase
MPYILRVAAGELSNLKIFGNDYETPDGTGVRDYIHVDDLADGHVKALSYCGLKNGFEMFNLGTGRGYSVLDMISAFEINTGVKISREFTRRRSGDVSSCFANVQRANKELGWTSKFDLDAMCTSSWDFYSRSDRGASL